jgi:CubicO group peptidase (beta-lactamase class C family)
MLHTRKLTYILFIFGLIISLFIPSLLGHAQSDNQLDLQAIDSFLQEQVKANRIPGMAVAIVQGNEVVFIKGYGEAAPGKPVTPQTQFYIGSVTKSFTALATMQLVEQGKLELDAPVQKYLPWFEVADPEASSKITVRHLLNHTSGLTEKGDPNPSAYTSSLEEQARLLADVQPTSSAGSRYEYYNQNYRLLGLLIEQVSGQSYGDYLHNNIFEPLGMTNTVTNPAEATSLAQGYSRAFGFPLPQSQRYIPGALPSGYLITTAEDMSQFVLAQLHNRKVNGKPMLDAESLATMRTSPAGIKSEYGMGWLVMENGNTLVHGGALENFHAFVALGLKEEVGLVILCNQNSMENMLFENNAVRDGLLNFLNDKVPQKTSYGWIGWLLLILATLDLLNHLRLFWMLPRWVQKTSAQNRVWLWIKVLVGILIPLAVIFGLPPLMHAVEGGAANWVEPFKLMPDLTAWLLLGMSLNLIRSLMHAIALLRQPKPQSN